VPDLYEILGVEKTATQEEIKRAYWAKAKAMHPDAGGNAADFELLAWANQILSDPEKREQYDAIGYADIRSEDKRTSEAWTLIGTLLNTQLTAVSDPTEIDLIAKMLAQLRVSWAETERQMRDLEKRITQFEGAQSRMSVSEGENRLAKMIGAEIEKMRRELGRHRESLEIGKLVREILREYSYDASIPGGHRKEKRRRGRK
jgi:curved DNA-binding protein CbpA